MEISMNAKAIIRAGIILFAAQIFSSAALFAPAKTFSVRQEDSHIGFAIYKWAVFKEEGRFKDFTGSIVYGPQNPSASRVEFTVQAKSIDSRNEGRDSALRSREFFHVEKYPTLTFKSTQVSTQGADTLLVTGDLTMRGVTKRLTIPVKLLRVNRVRN
jgi:polyisoprenoid-binding protein YceI